MIEARFMILFPDNPGEILFATPLIRCLKNQVGGSYIYAVLQETNAWILNRNESVDEILTYTIKPDELIPVVKDLLPDYFIDLEGKKQYRRLKRKTKVLDFCIGRVKNSENLSQGERLFKLLEVFDVADDRKSSELFPASIEPEWLPENYLNGFAVLALDAPDGSKKVSQEQLVKLVSLIEKPLVITGTAAERPLADEIGKRTGCTIFPACGDFGPAETAAIISASRVVVSLNPFWSAASEALRIPVLAIDPENFENLPDSALWVRQWFI